MKEELETIFFYLRNKRYAISKMKTFIIPLDSDASENMQVIYSLYFYSLIALIDFVKDTLKQKHILNVLYIMFGGKDNYKYIRELRNSMIHRGLDVSSAGTVIANTNIAVPFSPYEVVDSKNPEIKYKPFTDNLLQLVCITEQINQCIYKICSNLKLLDFENLTKEKDIQRTLENPYMEEKFKQLSLDNIDKINYEDLNKGLKDIHQEMISKYFNTNDLLYSNL